MNVDFKCTEKVMKFTHVVTGDFFVLKEGDEVDLPDFMVSDFCRLGWGTSSAYPTGDREEGQKVLTADNSSGLYIKPALPTDRPVDYPSHSARTAEKIVDLKQGASILRSEEQLADAEAQKQ